MVGKALIAAAFICSAPTDLELYKSRGRDAGAVRFCSMLLTAGAMVIQFDPIFQGLAIALMAGEVASLLISRVAVPVFYYTANRKKYAHA